MPGSVGKTLSDSMQSAIDARTGVGIIGLAGVLLTGLGWIGNLRRAIDAVWARPPAQRPFLKEKTGDLLILAGLGFGLLASVAAHRGVDGGVERDPAAAAPRRRPGHGDVARRRGRGDRGRSGTRSSSSG